MRRWDKELMKKLEVVDRGRELVDEDYIQSLEHELATSNGYSSYEDMCYDSAAKMISALNERGLHTIDIGIPVF